MQSNYKLYLTVVLLALTTGACNIFGTSPDMQPVHNTNDSDVEDLVGHTWVMTDQQSSEGKELDYKNEDMYEIEFHADSLFYGKTGCNNTFSGSYIAQNGGSITIDSLVASQGGCPNSTDMGGYLDNLGSIDRFEVTGDQLKLGFGDQGVFLYSKE